MTHLRDLQPGDSFRLVHRAEGDPLHWTLLSVDKRVRLGFRCRCARGAIALFYGSTEVEMDD